MDPDNRRPVDFELRRPTAGGGRARVQAGDPETRARFLADLVANPEDGRLKLHVIRAALAARNQRPAAFRSRSYVPLDASGRSAARVIAFGRGEGSERLVAVVPRLLAGHVVNGVAPTDRAIWDGTDLPLPPAWPSRWTCVLSGRTLQSDPDRGLRAADLFSILPVALLLAQPDS